MLAFTIPGLAAALAIAGCGSQSADSVSARDSGTVRPASPPKTDLTVSVKAAPGAPAKTWKLTCDPTGGDHPAAAAACGTLAAARKKAADPFAPTPKGQMCTQIYGGPEVATVKGTWQGKSINAAFNRKNGCEIQRWSDLAPLLGKIPPGR